MAEKEKVTLFVPSHKTRQSGNEEAIGFFIIKVDFEPVWGRPKLIRGQPNLMRWDSLADAVTWVEQKYGPLEVKPAQRAAHGIPILWTAAHQGQIIDILYIGAYRYPAGHLVDPLIVGTDAENFSGTVQ